MITADQNKGGDTMTTSDLSKFGWMEKQEAAKLLTLACKGLPKDFNDDEVTIMMNENSGKVFLTNSDFQVAMIHNGELASWYSCPECGHEGFLEDMDHGDSKDCKAYYREIKKAVA